MRCGGEEGTQNNVNFLLVLGDPFIKEKEDDEFKHRWYVDPELSKKVHESLRKLYKNLADNDLISESDIINSFLEHLKEVDIIACEDKRVSSKLLTHYGISKPLLSYHDHNANQMRPQLLALLKEGKNIAYITDAGMPLISDPGFQLVKECQKEKLSYTVLPGPSAPLMALVLSGLSPNQFLFCGFVASKEAERQKAFEEVKFITATLLFFESPKRLLPFCA